MQSKGYADESAKGVAGTGRCVCVCVGVCVCVWYEKGGLETLLYLSSIIIHGLVVTNIQPFRCSRGGLVGSSSKPS